MPKSRPVSRRPLPKRPPSRARIALAAKTPKARALPASGKKRPPAKVRLHQSGNPEIRKPPARQIPWWVFPENERGLIPGGPGGFPGPGPSTPPPRPPGPGPVPPPPSPPGLPGPPPRPPGPPPGLPGPPGPFPPPPPPRPPGPPGPFPPPPPRPPGPGPFPPPRPPWPLPLPIPVPVPIPTLAPVPYPAPVPVPSASFVTVQISGGYAFPEASRTAYVSYYPGLTIRQALALTGLVAFGPAGSIVLVSGVPIGGRTIVRFQYNGYVVPMTLLDYPADPNSTIWLEIYNL